MPLAAHVNPILATATPPPARHVAQNVVEHEMRSLPHLRSDQRHVARRVRHQQRDARWAKHAVQAVGSIPAADECLHLIVTGRFAMWHVVPATLALVRGGGSLESLHVATLGFSKRNISALCELLDSGRIGTATLLASHYFKSTSTEDYEFARVELEKRPRARFLSCRTHAKLLLMKLTDGRTVTVESSANLRSCANIEQMTLIGDPGVYAFHAAWIDGLFAVKGNPHE